MTSLILLVALTGTATAQRPPLYWSPYEYNFRVDGTIPEKEWTANIDWVDQNLKPYGYRMICIDGWGDEVYNENGYRASHTKEWKHDYAWWAKNLRSRGMELGIYNNPLWITKAAAEAGVKIKGTNIPIKSLIDEKAKGIFNWVEVDRPGAEQYVKGYVQFYADMGIHYLRADFLSWYESGRDRNMPNPVGRTDRSLSHYTTALRWIREACDKNGIFLSLVMPNLNREAELEKKYGHMIRINDDAGEGGWRKWSDSRRGVRLPGWSQWANPFDGLTYWSYLTGPGKLILDPDFLRLNTFANDEERKAAASLCLMAGAPVTVSDQYNSIGDSLWIYQNRELLALNAEGFVGKPLTNDPTKEESQTWTGKAPNGDWLVGFFNRESEPRTRSIEFSSLGLKEQYVRDLWRHRNLGRMTAFTGNVPPHGCIILRLTSRKPTQADSPELNLPRGLYTSPQTVSLTGTQVRYTLDGSDPTENAIPYTGPIQLAKTTTIKAKSFSKNLTNSETTTATYRIHPASPLPAPWKTADLGQVGIPGTASWSNDSLTLTAAGADIEGTQDSFSFVYQPIAGDFTLTAHLTAMSVTEEWAKAGLMLRQDLTPGSRNLFLALTRSHGIALQTREAPNQPTKTQLTNNRIEPMWLKITRKGNQIQASYSPDAQSWTTSATTTFPGPLLLGPALTSHQTNALGYAIFDKISLKQ